MTKHTPLTGLGRHVTVLEMARQKIKNAKERMMMFV